MELPDPPPLPKFVEARRQRVFGVIEAMNISPTSVNVPMRMLQLQRSKHAGLSDFGKALQCDAALASKVLATVNSSFFSPPRPVTRVTDAVTMIGLNNLLPLVFGLSLAGIFNPTDLPPSERSLLWRMALLKGIVARERCRMLGGKDCFEEAFLCGLFQDIALPAMLTADRAAAMELGLMLDADEREERERALFGGTHAEFGARLLRKLGVPELYIVMTANHHDDFLAGAADGTAESSSTSEFKSDPIAKMIQPAARLAAAVPHRVAKVEGYRGDRMRQVFLTDVAARLASHVNDLTPTQTEMATAEFYKFVGAVNEQYTRLCAQLNDSDESSSVFKAFLQQVCEQVAQSMTAAIGESARTINQLSAARNDMQQRIGDLETQVQAVDIDPLTEALNRRGFMKRAAKVMDLAREFNGGALVGYVDLDNFKQVNDRYGHEGGDAALQALAKALRDAIHDHGVVGRAGGDEFIIAATCAIDLKESLCTAVEQAMQTLQFPLPDGSMLPLTTSCGLAWIERPAASDDIHSALKRADGLMYEAKRAGKARCVIAPLLAA